MKPTLAAALASVALLGACTGTTGTLSVTLATAPGSQVLANAAELQLTLTAPHKVITVPASANGTFTLTLDVDATTATGNVIVSALDTSGTVIATGMSPPFTADAIDATIVIYMAAPNSIAAAPVALSNARGELGVGTLSYGAIFAGGLDATGAPSTAIEIYNAYDHSLSSGLAIPSARAGLAVGVDDNDDVYLFGGTDANNAPAGDLWFFDTQTAPSGAYTALGVKTGFERANQLMLTLGNATLLITGTPPLVMATDGTLTARTDIASLPAAGASVLVADGTVVTILAGPSGIIRFRNDTFDMLATTDQTGASVAALPDGKVLVACGTAGSVVIDAAAGTSQAVALPVTPMPNCATVANPNQVILAGGTDAEIYDATTFAAVATAPLVVPRTGATAVALPNNQFLIAGGVDTSGAPIATLELFTPAPSE